MGMGKNTNFRIATIERTYLNSRYHCLHSLLTKAHGWFIQVKSTAALATIN